MPGDSKKLDRILEIVSDNNQMLRTMRRHAMWGIVFKVVLYAVLFGIPVVLYFSVLQPMLKDVMGVYTQIQTTGNASMDSLGGVLRLLGL